MACAIVFLPHTSAKLERSGAAELSRRLEAMNELRTALLVRQLVEIVIRLSVRLDELESRTTKGGV